MSRLAAQALVELLQVAVLYWFGLTGDRFWWGHWELLDRGFHPLSILFFVSGSLMISTIRVPKP